MRTNSLPLQCKALRHWDCLVVSVTLYAPHLSQLDHLDDIGPPPASKMRKRSSWEAGEAGLASSSHRWPTQSKLAKMSRAMSPYTSYGSFRVTMKLENTCPEGLMSL